MTTREMLEQVLQELPEHRLGEVLDFARFLGAQDEDEAWQRFGRVQLAEAYGDDEPEYSEGDLQAKAESTRPGDGG